MRLCPSCEVAYLDEVALCPRDGSQLPGGAQVPPVDPLVGAIVGQRYRLLERLGEGRTAVVYRAEHEPLQAPVVIKLAHSAMSDTPERVKRFLLQARVAGLVRQGAPAVFDVGVL